MVAAIIPAPADAQESLAAANVEVHVGGNLSGTLVAGNYNIVNTADGAVINVFRGKLTVERRPVPVQLRPRPFPGLLGRKSEVATVTGAVDRSLPFEFYAEPGWGKSALLRHLASHLSPAAHAEGVVYERAADHSVPDLLQFIFDAFYRTSVPIKATEGQLRHYLQPVRALIVLDDLDLSREEVETLLFTVPNSVFVVTSIQRNLWGDGAAAALRGLEIEEGLELFEREVGRKLTSGERAVARRLWQAVSGQPLRLIEAAALASGEEQKRVLAAPLLREAAIPYRLTSALVQALPDIERRVLGVLAAIPDAVVAAEHVAALTGIYDAASLLRRLEERGLVEPEDAGFRLRPGLAAAFAAVIEPERWRQAVVDHFARWAESHAYQPALLLEQAPALLAVLRAAQSMGAREQALRLARAIQFSFALAARWGDWEAILRHALWAAQALGDRAAAAWAFHQLGTRLLCLGNVEEATAYLQRALHLRRSAGDRRGEAITRHNLRRLRPRGWLSLRLLVGAGAAVAGVAAAIVVASGVLAGSGEATFDPPRLDLGPVPVGYATSGKVTLQNSGRGALAISGITVEGDYTQSNDCPSKRGLATRERCTVTVTFEPKASGPRSGRLTVNGARGRAAALVGSGSAGNVWLQPSHLEFADQRVGQASAYQDVQLTNTGNAPLTVTGIAPSGDFEMISKCGPMPATLSSQSGCTLSVRFTPRVSGRRDGSLVVKTSSGPASVALTGQGTAAPSPTMTPGTPTPGTAKPELSPTEVDFGRQTVEIRSPPKQATLKNVGTGLMTVSKIFTTGDFSTDANCPTVQPGKQCEITVYFQPTIGGGVRGDLVVEVAGTEYKAVLVGTGLVPLSLITAELVPGQQLPEPVYFGPSSKPVTFFITNKGDGVLLVASVDVKQVDYKDALWTMSDNQCAGARLDPGKFCNLTLTFNPPRTGGGSVKGSLTVTSNGPPASFHINGSWG